MVHTLRNTQSGLLLGVRSLHGQGHLGDEWRRLLQYCLQPQSLVVRGVLTNHTSSLVALWRGHLCRTCSVVWSSWPQGRLVRVSASVCRAYDSSVCHVPSLVSNVQCVMSPVWSAVYSVLCPQSGQQCTVCYVSSLVSSVQCVMYPVSSAMYSVLCTQSGKQCTVCYVPGLVSSVQCVMSPVW